MSHGHELPGHGQIVGRARPEYGPDIYDLACDRCGAGWSGEPGDPCGWCQRKVEEMGGTLTVDGEGIHPPSGYRWWRPGDDEQPRPVLAPAARHGVIGDYLDAVETETEAGVAAVGAVLLAQAGTRIGRRAVVRIGEITHYPNLFILAVGETSTGAKGTAEIAARILGRACWPEFPVLHTIGGFGSGEAVIAEFVDKPDEPAEKRKLINEPEFSAVLRICRRESSILSEVIRKGFDDQPLQHRTKTGGKLVAADHHLSIIGSITPSEFVTLSTEVDIANGWLNRFLMIHAAMREPLPFGGFVNPGFVEGFAARVNAALEVLEHKERTFLIRPDTELGKVWAPWYRSVRAGTGATAMMRALTARQHAHAARLALIFAVLDLADDIHPEHFDAATAWTDYSVATTAMLFGARASGDDGKLLDAVRAAGPDGLARQHQSAVFGRNRTAEQLDVMLDRLVDQNLVAVYDMPTEGRTAKVAIALTPYEVRKKGVDYEGTHPSFVNDRLPSYFVEQRSNT